MLTPHRALATHRYGTLYEGYTAKWVHFEVVVLLRKAAAAAAVVLVQDPVAQAASIAIPSTMYCAAVWLLRPFAAVKGTLFGRTVDVLNDTEFAASAVVALNQLVFLLNGAAIIPFTNAWGAALAALNLLMLLVLAQLL